MVLFAGLIVIWVIDVVGGFLVLWLICDYYCFDWCFICCNVEFVLVLNLLCLPVTWLVVCIA